MSYILDTVSMLGCFLASTLESLVNSETPYLSCWIICTYPVSTDRLASSQEQQEVNMASHDKVQPGWERPVSTKGEYLRFCCELIIQKTHKMHSFCLELKLLLFVCVCVVRDTLKLR